MSRNLQIACDELEVLLIENIKKTAAFREPSVKNINYLIACQLNLAGESPHKEMLSQ